MASELTEKIVKLLDENHCKNIVSIDVAGKTDVADTFVVCSARNPNAGRAAYDIVTGKLEDEGIFASRADGVKDGRWIAIGSIPLSKLLPGKPEPGYGTAARFRMNLFRTSPGMTTLCWSPTYTAQFLDGIYRMGEVELARPKDK